MKFLVDNALSWMVAEGLCKAGFDAVHVRDIGMAASPDSEILARALQEGRIVVTADSDFASMHALAGTTLPSVIQLREGTTRRPERQQALLLANLPAIQEDLERGAIVVFDDRRMRIRPLPIPR